jgi:chorismate mutase/prephenate dehydrogenase
MIEKIRKEIDAIDEELIGLIKKRLSLMSKVAAYKIKNNMPIVDSRRENEVIASKRKTAEELNINPNLIEGIYKELIKESRQIQESIIKGKNEKSEKD